MSMSREESTEGAERATVSLPAPLARRLRLEARSSGRKVSAIVREALEEHFTGAGKGRLPSFVGIGRSGRADISERVEELIREHVRKRGR